MKLKLLKNCFQLLKNNGIVFIQDFFHSEINHFATAVKNNYYKKKIAKDAMYHVEDLTDFLEKVSYLGFTILFINKIEINDDYFEEINEVKKLQELKFKTNSYEYIPLEPFEIILRKNAI